MWKYKSAQTLILPLVFVLVLAFCANAGIAQTTDETSLVRSVATSFFEAYQRKDADGLIALWSTKAPDLTSFTTDVRQKATIAGDSEMKSFEIRRVTVDGASAIVRVKVELQPKESTSGTNGPAQLNRTLHLVKEDGRWKVWQYEPSERELATNLIAAKTENDRKALLDAEPDLITLELVQS
jgi:ketosteroid isomerase-like protein